MPGVLAAFTGFWPTVRRAGGGAGAFAFRSAASFESFLITRYSGQTSCDNTALSPSRNAPGAETVPVRGHGCPNGPWRKDAPALSLSHSGRTHKGQTRYGTTHSGTLWASFDLQSR